jgi:hypothetical protein
LALFGAGVTGGEVGVVGVVGGAAGVVGVVVGGAAGEVVGGLTGVVGELPEGVVVAGGVVLLVAGGADEDAVEVCPLLPDPPQALNKHVSARAAAAARKGNRSI